MKKLVRISIFIVIILVTSSAKTNVYGQFEPIFVQFEDSLKELGPIILNGESDFIKYDAAEKFLLLLEEALTYPNSFEHPFDSLYTISKLTSPDKQFRVFSWNLPKSDGSYEHYGIIQSLNKHDKKYDVYVLIDKSDEIINPENQTLNADHWYGAHYYRLIEKKHRQKEYYTLLGWDGNNNLTTKKVIEVLTFRSNGRPVFGAYIFRDYEKRPKRIIFEYSNRSSMFLNYDEQTFKITEKKKYNKKKHKWKEKVKTFQAEMIVFDFLVPLNESLKGYRQYYVPATNIIDSFVFYDGKWHYMHDIDARNPERILEYIPPSERVKQKNFYDPENP